MPTTASFSAELWEHLGEGGWHFITLPLEVGDDLREAPTGPRRGFGSLRVQVTLGASVWQTSVFPSKDGSYVLPVKAAVRRAEGMVAGDVVQLELVLRDA